MRVVSHFSYLESLIVESLFQYTPPGFGVLSLDMSYLILDPTYYSAQSVVKCLNFVDVSECCPLRKLYLLRILQQLLLLLKYSILPLIIIYTNDL